MVYSILTSQKYFGDRWVGHAGLNRLGLHRARVKTAMALGTFRRWQRPGTLTRAECELRDNGVAIVSDFLPEQDFQSLYKEVSEAAAIAHDATPYPEPTERGFGKERRHDWGFDRFDGSTLNRFIDPGPLARQFARHPALRGLTRVATGRSFDPRRGSIYESVSHEDRGNPDIQRDFHRDTFFNAVKFWYFLEPVRDEDGPFVYVPTSHKLTSARLAWEDARAAAAVEASCAGDTGGMGGAFRISRSEIAQLGLPDPLTYAVPANTLVIANVFGFHRRGDGEPGTKRLALYGNHRPYPFRLLGS